MSGLLDVANDRRLLAYLQAVERRHGYIRLTDVIQDRAIAANPIERLFVEPALSEQHVTPEQLPEFDGPVRTVLEALRSNDRVVILGDPGSGKSTVVSWISSCLASRIPNIYKTRLGDLVPVPMVLRDLDWQALNSWQDLVEQFCQGFSTAAGETGSRIPQLEPPLVAELMASGQALMLLDGVDELASLRQREMLRALVVGAALEFPNTRWVFTSRIVGYEDCPFDQRSIPARRDPRSGRWEADQPDDRFAPGPDLTHLPQSARFYVAPFDDTRIEAYAQKWHRVIEPDSSLAARNAARFLSAVRAHPHLEGIARIPILLAYLAVVQLRFGMLPNGRTDVYSRVSEMFLDSIPLRKGIESTPFRLDQKLRWLSRIGLAMQARRLGEGGQTALLIKKAEALELLGRFIAHDEPIAPPETAGQFLEFVSTRAGLLLERGSETYAFVHLSFQEYFAGSAIAEAAGSRRFQGRIPSSGDVLMLQADAQRGLIEPESLPAVLAQWACQVSMREALRHAACLLGEESAFLLAGSCVGCLRPLTSERERAARDLAVELACSPDVRLTDERRRAVLVGAGLTLKSRQDLAVLHSILQLNGAVARAAAPAAEPAGTILSYGSSQITDQGLTALASLTGLQSLDLSSTKITDQGLAALASLTGLQSLNLSSTQITDQGLAALASLTGLQSLNLSSTKITDQGLAALASLTGLLSLNLSDTKITDQGLAALASLTGLQSLNLSSTKITDQGLAALASLTGLLSLNLSDTKITDQGLAALASLTGLLSLNLWNTKITDQGLAALASLTGLQSLNLWNTEITDRGLAALASLTGPLSLDLSWTKITDKGLAALASLTGLQSLNLWNTKITDQGLAALASLTGLLSLNLSDTKITDQGLAALASLTGLLSLNLWNTEITDRGLAALASLTGPLSLDLSWTKITDKGLAALASLTGLQSLNLSWTKITDKGLAALASLTGLQSLNLWNTKITDQGLAALASLTGLLSLNLSDTKITDQGLAALASLTGLLSLDLSDTKITDQGLMDLSARISAAWLAAAEAGPGL